MRRLMMAAMLGMLGMLGMMAAGRAEAGLIVADPGTGTTTIFDVTGSRTTPGPVTIDGFSVTGNPSVTYGNGFYIINPNGQWTQSYISTNNPDGSVTIDLGGLYGLVGGLLNYGPGSGADPTITALGAGGNVLESYDLATSAPISTPGATNAGAFRGISRAGDDIRFLQISGSFILEHSIEVGAASAAAATPEPATLGSLALAAIGSGFYAWRRRRRSA